MADEKKYLDLVGLQLYDEKIKAYIKANGSDVTDKLVALIGAAEKGEDEATILARIADLEAAVGDVSELGEEVENLVKAILGEATRAQGAESDLQDAIDGLNEKLYGTGEGEEHVDGDIDKIQDRLTAIEEDTADADAVAALEEKLYGKGEGEEHVDGDLDKINAAIAAEQERAEGAEGDILDFVGELPEDATAETVVGYAEEIVAAEEAARKAQIGDLGKVSEEEGAADHTVKSYVDAAVEAINGDADELGDRVEALEALHAKKTVGEGDAAKEVFKTVAEEVNEAVTDLIDGAPDALDTLKEIADWIANQDESGVTDAATLVARVEENAQAIADETERAEGVEGALTDLTTDAKTNLVAAINEVDANADAAQADVDALEEIVGTATTDEADGTGLIKRIEDLEAFDGQEALEYYSEDDLGATIDVVTIGYGSKFTAVPDQIAIESGVDGEKNTVVVNKDGAFYNNNEIATVANIGDLGKVSAEADAADHTVKSYVDAAVADVQADVDSYVRITEDEIEALFATEEEKQ